MDTNTPEKEVVELLLKNELTVSCAESCTGGLLSATLIDVPGISAVYKAGYITYANEAKEQILGVDKELLETQGAVSAAVAEKMALGAAAAAGADVAAGITGIAGPGGGTEQKPVGLVYISCNVKGIVTVEEHHFSGSRKDVRESSVSAALSLMRRCILDYYGRE